MSDREAALYRGRVEAFDAVSAYIRQINGNGHDEPSDPALDAVHDKVNDLRSRATAALTVALAASPTPEPREPEGPGEPREGLDENPWLDQLVRAERENHCGDLACQTRRTAAAVHVLTGWKEHQDYAWAVEAFEVEIGVRDPALLGKEPENIPSRAAIAAEAFERGRLFAITGSGTQTIPTQPDPAALRAALPTGDVIRAYFREHGWTIHMDDREGQAFDPFAVFGQWLAAAPASKETTRG